MEILSSFGGDKNEFCLAVKFVHARSYPGFDITYA